jgi:hypothetical protein
VCVSRDGGARFRKLRESGSILGYRGGHLRRLIDARIDGEGEEGYDGARSTSTSDVM